MVQKFFTIINILVQKFLLLLILLVIIKILQLSISRRQNCIEECKYFKNCYGGCNANAILNESNRNNVSCYIQKGILEGIKNFIIELNNQKEYDKLNYSLSKILIRRDNKR